MPDESNGSPARFGGRNQRLSRRGRGRSTSRRIGASFRGNSRRRNFGLQFRQGRQFPSQDVLPRRASGRRGRGRSPFRRNGASFRGNNRRRNFGFQFRRGRQFPSQEFLPPPEEVQIELDSPQLDYDDQIELDSPPLDYDDQVQEEVAESIAIPHWCNPSHNLGSWMNFSKMRTWCADNGYSKFGPYGSAPSNNTLDEVESGNEVDGPTIEEDYDY